MSDLSARYAFDRTRFAVRAWPDQGGVVYDGADATLYELSALACEVLSLLQAGEVCTAAALAQHLIGETPDAEEVLLMEDMLAQLVDQGILSREVQ